MELIKFYFKIPLQELQSLERNFLHHDDEWINKVHFDHHRKFVVFHYHGERPVI